MDVRLRDDRERAVVELWRRGHLSWSTVRVYLNWVRCFRTYCDQRKLIEADELSSAGALRFARNYTGPRLNGRRCARSSRESARNAIHAWACALRSLGARLPAWKIKPEPRVLPPLLNDYCEYRRAHAGVAETTLTRDVDTVQGFLQYLTRRRRLLNNVAYRRVHPEKRRAPFEGEGRRSMQFAAGISEVSARDRAAANRSGERCNGAEISRLRKAAANVAVARCEAHSTSHPSLRTTGQTRLRDAVAPGNLWPRRGGSAGPAIGRPGLAGRHSEGMEAENQSAHRVAAIAARRKGADLVLAVGATAGEGHRSPIPE